MKKKIFITIIVFTILIKIIGSLWLNKTSTEYSVNGEQTLSTTTSSTIVGDTAQEIVKDMKVGWNLGNSLCTVDCLNKDVDSFESTIEYTNYYEHGTANKPITTKEMIDEIKKAGFNTVRLPISWKDHLYRIDENGEKIKDTAFDELSVDEISQLQIEEVWINRVEEIVNYVLENNMYCIINVHHDVGVGRTINDEKRSWIYTSTDENQKLRYEKALEVLWSQIAEKFKDYDSKLIFEGFNEIMIEGANDETGWVSASRKKNGEYVVTEEHLNEVNKLNQVFVDTVRRSGGNNGSRFLMINTYGAHTADRALEYFKIPTDSIENHIIMSVHIYDNEAVCIEGTDNNVYNALNKVKEAADNLGVPVVIGEFGSLLRPPDPENRWRTDWDYQKKVPEAINYFVRTASELGITCIYWDDGHPLSYSCFNRTTLSWDYPDINPNKTYPDILKAIIKGSKGRPLEEEYYDVTTFGANGQDSQNDALAIQEALDKAKETNSDIIVYVPEGTYYIDRQLKIYSNTTLSLNDNAVIINSTGKVQMLRTGHLNSDGTDCSGATCTHGGYTQWENITIEGGTWDFNNDGSGNSNGIYTPHGQGLTIRNATFMNSSGHTLNVSASKDILIENVIIKNQISSEPKKADDTNESIHLDSATTGGEPWAYPIDNTPIKNVTIQNCTFENVLCGIGSHLNYSDENVMEDNIIIKNNTFKDVKCYAINIYAHKNVEIYGNTATGKNTNNILSNTNEAYGFVHTYYANANIHDNKVKNFEYTVIKDTKNSEYTITCDDERICNKFFIIEYEPNGGTGTMEQTVVEYGVSKKLSKNKFKKYGYKFGGWTAHRTYPGSFTWICTDNKWYTEEEIEQNGYTKAIYKNEQGVAKTGWWHHSIVEMYAQWIKREKIEISSKPTKLTYLQNSENLDLSGGVIKSTYEDGSSDTIDLTDENVHVTGFNNSKFGTQTLTVDYEGKQTTFEVTVTQKLTSTKYTVDEEQKILTDIELETTVDIFKTKITGITNYTIQDKNGTTLTNNEFIPTGAILKTNVGDYTLIVKGDLNGDGSLKLNDLAMAQKIFLELSEPENLKVKAADLNKDGRIDINDLSKLQKMFLGI